MLSEDNQKDRPYSNQSANRLTSPTVGLARQPGRDEDCWGCRCRDEEQVNLLPVVARHDEGERLCLVGHTSDGFALKVQNCSQLGERLSGYLCLLREVFINETLVLEMTRNARRKELWPQSRFTGKTMREEKEGHQKTALTMTSTCAVSSLFWPCWTGGNRFRLSEGRSLA